MVDIILDHYQAYLKAITLQPSDGGVFDIRVDGERVYSGLEQGGRFPSEDDVIKLVGPKVGAS